MVLAFGLVSGLSITLKLNASKLKLPTNKKVLGLQQQTEVLAAQNSVSSKSCFDYYIPVLNSVTIQYEVAYAQCQKNYDTASDLVLKSWNSTLYGIQAAGDSGCTTFFDCSSIVDYVQAFECFADVVSWPKLYLTIILRSIIICLVRIFVMELELGYTISYLNLVFFCRELSKQRLCTKCRQMPPKPDRASRSTSRLWTHSRRAVTIMLIGVTWRTPPTPTRD